MPMELSIGELAQRAGVTRRTIRYDVELGLLPPPEGAGKAAVYGPEHLERLQTIKELQAYRLSLEEIRERLAGKPRRELSDSAADRLMLTVQDARETPTEDASAAGYIARLRERAPAYRQARLFSRAITPAGEPEGERRGDFDAEQWLRVSLSEDVELHVRRRASRSQRWLNRLIKEAK